MYKAVRDAIPLRQVDCPNLEAVIVRCGKRIRALRARNRYPPLRRARTAWSAHVRAPADAARPRAVSPCGPVACRRAGTMRSGRGGKGARRSAGAIDRDSGDGMHSSAAGHLLSRGKARTVDRSARPVAAPITREPNGCQRLHPSRDASFGIRRTAWDARLKPQSDDTVAARERAGCTKRARVMKCGASGPFGSQAGPGITKPERSGCPDGILVRRPLIVTSSHASVV